MLLDSVKPELSFGTDDEAMSYPGNNIDPRTKRYDMSNDPITYAADIINIVDEKINELPEIFADEESFNNYTNAFFRFFRTKGRFLETVAQQIGGVYVNKISSVQDDKTILEAVPYDKQKQAMALLSEKVFWLTPDFCFLDKPKYYCLNLLKTYCYCNKGYHLQQRE